MTTTPTNALKSSNMTDADKIYGNVWYGPKIVQNQYFSTKMNAIDAEKRKESKHNINKNKQKTPKNTKKHQKHQNPKKNKNNKTKK